uniref:Uncharacterized protein n=1 Tax=Romanomermis culicivorax TaxID=13658 RepID=A0A915J591_ROMCU
MLPLDAYSEKKRKCSVKFSMEYFHMLSLFAAYILHMKVKTRMTTKEVKNKSLSQNHILRKVTITESLIRCKLLFYLVGILLFLVQIDYIAATSRGRLDITVTCDLRYELFKSTTLQRQYVATYQPTCKKSMDTHSLSKN